MTARYKDGRRKKLTWQKVNMIRALRFEKNEKQDVLALQFGITQSMVSKIIRGAQW